VAKKRALPVIASPPAPIVVKGKEIKAVEAMKPSHVTVTAAQLLQPANDDQKVLSELFLNLCGKLGVVPTKRQARKARQGEGAWSKANPLTPLLRKVA